VEEVLLGWMMPTESYDIYFDRTRTPIRHRPQGTEAREAIEQKTEETAVVKTEREHGGFAILYLSDKGYKQSFGSSK